MRARVRGPVPVVVHTGRRRGTASRALWTSAEALVTCGVLVLLLVVHQLWWTNQQARAGAVAQVRNLEREWDSSPPAGPSPPVRSAPDPGPSPPVPSSSDGSSASSSGGAPPGSESFGGPPGRASASAFAVLRIPRLGLSVPVAHGVGRRGVLDKGYAGHYPGTAQPGRTGNFALAGHRNTHGEPFRYVNRLRAGDPITVRTRDGTYTYRVDRILPQTSPRDTGVIAPVPRSLHKPSYGYDRPGAYLTLTTCTPEFTSTYRLVVWALLVGGP
ncbi:class E sortase [Streptomyces roseicoloratus]|uniref:class E sortase n=1 Tax=Streptomyces roseicoloratus TaxID=2508722 RepID=UPI001009CADC|nr:class E sortase [Streptomyces roseicoloratus]